jgi:multidrug efflux system outer membrane protein
LTEKDKTLTIPPKSINIKAIKNVKYTYFLILALLCGCVVGPEYCPPTTEAPEDWKFSCEENDCPGECVDFWWEIFHDPILDQLEEQAVNYNKTLDNAVANILSARGTLGVTASQQYPQIGINPFQASQEVELYKFFSEPGFNIPTVDLREKVQNYQLPLVLNYELDLWGKYFNQTRSAYANYESVVEQYYGALLTVTTDLALNYFQLRAMDTVLAIYKKTLESLQDQLDIVNQRLDTGLDTDIDVKQAVTLYNSVKTQYTDVFRQRALYEDAIAVLIGQPASDFCIGPNELKDPPPCVPPGLPFRMLKRRPDIAASERMLESATYLIGAAQADFYPDFSFTGQIGFLSPDLSKFLSWKSRLYGWLINAVQPLFTGERIESNVEKTQADLLAAVANYEQQVLAAFQEVEDSLAAIHYYKEQLESQTIATQSAGEVVQLSTQRYTRGIVNYLEVVDSEQTYLNNQRTQAGILSAEYVSTIQLIRALGGGWDYTVD